MARLTLSDRECHYDELPMICMKCGAEATYEKSKLMKWESNANESTRLLMFFMFGVLGALIFSAATKSSRKSMRLTTTFCDEHRNYWWQRQIYGTLLPSIGVLGFILGMVALALIASQPKFNGQDIITGIVFGSGAILMIVMLLVGVFSKRAAIKPTEITDDDITLINLSIGYVEAVKEQRAERRAQRDARREEAEPRRVPKARPVVREQADEYEEPFDAQRRRDWGEE